MNTYIQEVKKIKAWAFIATNRGVPYFVLEDTKAEIFLTKPKPTRNPFDYFGKNSKWKPTALEITIKYKKPCKTTYKK